MLAKNTKAYASLRWAYQPVKQSVFEIKRLAAIPRHQRNLRKYMERSGFKGIQIGTGTCPHAGWLNTDVPGTPAEYSLDIEKRLPFADLSLDAIYGSEVIEHIPKESVSAFAREAYRVLKHGGALRLTTPNADAICAIYSDRNAIAQHGTTWLEGDFSPTIWLNAMFRSWGHQWIWSFESLAAILELAGFAIERAAPQQSKFEKLRGLETRYGTPAPAHCWSSSMIIEATK
jgi:predicted SAM-dependent methyltransferase